MRVLSVYFSMYMIIPAALAFVNQKENVLFDICQAM
jgi:hypothetical protein